MNGGAFAKKVAFALLPPLGVCAAAEIALRAAGVPAPRYVGYPARYWVSSAEPGKPPGWVRATPRTFRYAPEPKPLFLRDKPANGLRVFFLGDSLAFGWPYEIGGSSDWLRVRLVSRHPDRRVEVVNAGNPGWHAAETRVLLQECLERQADVVVWMAGNSEFTPENMARLDEELDRRPAAAVRSALLDLRIVTLLGRVAPAFATRRVFLAENLASAGIPCHRAPLARVTERFRRSVLGAVADARAAGARIVLCTLPRNVRRASPHTSVFSAELRDDPERRARFDEAFTAGELALASVDGEGALAALERARAIDASPAKLHHALGRALELLGRRDAANAAYREAVERDGCPTRVPEAFEDAIRSVAAEERVPLVDLERVFDAACAEGLAGNELLTDNAHPNLEGHELVAAHLIACFERDLGLGGTRPEPPRDRLALDMGFPGYHEYLIARGACVSATTGFVRGSGDAEARGHAAASADLVLRATPEDWEVVATRGVLDLLDGRREQGRERLDRALHRDAFVLLNTVVQARTDPAWERLLRAADIDVDELEASIPASARIVIENRIARARLAAPPP
ncbi:MAG TPA: SGNH/GDSL hydrolase family protein [Planctomycetota bacterium]|nr:SGNH/GDSL hydrolase family protein [Planctomycetota bacterium]